MIMAVEEREVAYNWSELFKYIGDYSKRSTSESESLLECLCDKLQHCILSIGRLIDCIPDSTNASSDIIYITVKLQDLLAIIRCKYSECSAKLLALQRNIAITETEQGCMRTTATSELITISGRCKIAIDIDAVSFLRSISMKWNEIARFFGVSKSTIPRRCNEANYIEPYTSISNQELKKMVSDFKSDYPDAGERIIHAAIRSKGFKVSRSCLRDIIHEIDPIGTSLRWNAKLTRRKYSVPGPNSLWHIGMYSDLCIEYIYIFYFV